MTNITSTLSQNIMDLYNCVQYTGCFLLNCSGSAICIESLNSYTLLSKVKIPLFISQSKIFDLDNGVLFL